MDEPLTAFGIRIRVVEQMPAGIDFALVPDPIPIKTEMDEDGTVRSEIDVDELRRRMAIAKSEEAEDDGTDD